MTSPGRHDVRTEIEEMVCMDRPSVYQAGDLTIPMMDTATQGIVTASEQNRRRDVATA